MKTDVTQLETAHLSQQAKLRTALEVLDDIQIASPCQARWEDMRGDDRARHCALCNKMVYDLSELTTEAAAALVQSREETPCVRFYRRADGRILTADCPVGLLARLEKWGRRRGWMAWAVAFLVVGVVGWLVSLWMQPPPRFMGGIEPLNGNGGLVPAPPPEEIVLPMPRLDE